MFLKAYKHLSVFVSLFVSVQSFERAGYGAAQSRLRDPLLRLYISGAHRITCQHQRGLDSLPVSHLTRHSWSRPLQIARLPTFSSFHLPLLAYVLEYSLLEVTRLFLKLILLCASHEDVLFRCGNNLPSEVGREGSPT